MINPIYLTIAKDSFWGSFAPTVSGEFAYKIVLYFGKHDAVMASVAAFFGSVAGLTATYILFYGFALLLRKILNRNPNYPQVQHYTSKFAPVFGLIMVIPQVNVISPFFFGVAKLNWKKFLLILVVYRIAYYIFMLNTTGPLLG